MIEIFLQIFPVCLLFSTIAFIVIDEWQKQDQVERKLLTGRPLVVGDSIRILEEDGTPAVEIDINTYFDELPQHRRF